MLKISGTVIKWEMIKRETKTLMFYRVLQMHYLYTMNKIFFHSEYSSRLFELMFLDFSLLSNVEF